MNDILILLSQAIIDSGLLVFLQFVFKVCTGKARFSSMASSYSFGHTIFYVILQAKPRKIDITKPVQQIS